MSGLHDNRRSAKRRCAGLALLLSFALQALAAANAIAESQYAQLGVDTYEHTLAPQYGGVGLMVVHVIPGSAAEAAGVRVEDVILEVDGIRLISARQLFCHVQSRGPGGRVKLKISGSGDGAGNREIAVVLGLWRDPIPPPIQHCSAMH